MKWAPPGYGGQRRSPEDVKRAGWLEQGVLVISPADPRLTWPRKNDDFVDRMAQAIVEFGFRIPIVARSDGLVVDRAPAAEGGTAARSRYRSRGSRR